MILLAPFKKRYRQLAILVGFGLILSLALLPNTQGRISLTAQTTIQWVDKEVAVDIVPGEGTVKKASFLVSQADVADLSLKPVFQIDRFVKVQFSRVPTFPSNRAREATLSFSIPPETTPGTYAGLIRAFKGNTPLPGGLNVIINVLSSSSANLDVQITSPERGTVFNKQPITVSGTITGATPQTQVVVNGVQATISGDHFVASSVPLLRDGSQLITAVASTPGGRSSQASLAVALDTIPPTIVIDSPPSGLITADETIAVAGVVSDVITVNPAVTVNGVTATVNNGSFIAMGIPLTPGANQISAIALDGVGNSSKTTITVNRASQPGLRLTIISGQAQSGVAGTILPAPLIAQLLDIDGNPVPNREIRFQVTRGDGTLKNSPPGNNQNSQRELFVRTNANGQAAVQLTLGSRSGAANNRVQAMVAGGLSFVEFCATALSGDPDHINTIPMTDQQTGLVNRPLADAFGCVVSDALGNPVSGVPVIFRVAEGGGNLSGNEVATVSTGADGIAKAILTLGPEPGTQNNVVRVSFQGQTTPPTGFVASGRIPGAISNTTFSGLVLDNGDQPLQNARAVIFGTNSTAVTDDQGRFIITNVPPGAQRLVIQGGLITDALGRIFPDLEFDLNMISGVENSLPFPIYLPALATDSKSVATVRGPVTDQIVLQMPGVPEATLTLLPGTIVSNSKGPASSSNPITVRLSRVNNNRVPMPPPNGSLFMVAGTVQPAGTHFNPPAKVCIPNAGMPPGAQVDIFSFDHDVGRFLSIGPATVSEDGALLCSNPGFGIDKAGWYGCSPPPPNTTNVEKPSVTISPKPIFICDDNPTTISAMASPPGGVFEWRETSGGSIIRLSDFKTSTNGSGVTVGVATANVVGPGQTTITVEYKVSGQAIIDSVSVTVVKVEIGDIIRGPNLPFSISPSRTFDVPVTITPSLEGTGHYIQIDVINSSAATGTATLTSNNRLTANGMVTIKGGAQTKVGNGGQLKIRAKFDGMKECAQSKGFTVCAHPIAIGFDFAGIDSPLIFKGKPFWGAAYRLNFTCDSGNNSDCSQTKISEVVKVITASAFFAGAQDFRSDFMITTDPQTDHHGEGSDNATLMKITMEEFNNTGIRIDHQFFRFADARCGISEDIVAGPKVPTSGFRITKTISKEGEMYFVNVKKEGVPNNGVQAGPVNDTALKKAEVKDKP